MTRDVSSLEIPSLASDENKFSPVVSLEIIKKASRECGFCVYRQLMKVRGSAVIP
jgi:hypothetical protein